MAMRFCILGSGSSGNAAFLQTDGTRILIDAGFSARRLGQLLATIGESLENLDAIFLTHEHGDHTAGLTGLKRLPELKVFANHATAGALSRTLRHTVAWQVFQTGSRFQFRDITIETFPVPHDAAEPVGYVFDWGHDDLLSPRRRLGWLTDLGHLPQQVRERVRGVDVLVLEANYDDALLQADAKRPWSLKQRISGRHGHLSNQAACAFLADCRTEQPGLREVYLAHLSRDCNSLEAVEREFAVLRATPGVSPGFRITAVGPGESSGVLEWN